MLTREEAKKLGELLAEKNPDGSFVMPPDDRKRAVEVLREQLELELKFPWRKYANDPVRYAYEVLGVDFLTKDQKEVLLALLKPPYKVKVNSGNSLGKSFISAVAANFWFDSFDPGVVITTAPTHKHITDVIWAEIRLQRSKAKMNLPMNFIGPRAPEMRTSDEHWAIGITADKGEALSVDTEIETPSGKKRIGDVQVGDFVFGSSGQRTRVTGVYRHKKREVYKVAFIDGTSVVADGKHWWSVLNYNWGHSKPRLMTTDQLIKAGVKYGRHARNKFYIPDHGPAEYPLREVPIPSYTMGVWLGDGTCWNGTITSADDEMPGFLEKENESVTVRHNKNRTAKTLCVKGLHGALRVAGLLRKCTTSTKRVPREYMENSVEVRLAILQGLMDSDGTADASGLCSFTSTSKGLTEDVSWLVRSLGGRSGTTGKPDSKKRPGGGFYRECYTVSVRLKHFPLFRLPRKLERINKSSVDRKKSIESITPAGVSDTACITVEAADGLFLANDFIVTHNSFKGRHRERMLFIFDEDEGLAQLYYDTTRTMFKAEEGHAWLSIGNPTTTSSPAYLETRKVDENGEPLWKVYCMSALAHPNIEAGINGERPPVPNAVSVAQVDDWVNSLCDIVKPEERVITDFLWRGLWRRPTSEGETVILGRRPSGGTSGVWSDALWQACIEKFLPFPYDEFPEIGCDVARVLGGDDCDIHLRWGGNSLAHDSANGRPIPMTVDRLKQMAEEACTFTNKFRKEILGPTARPFFPTEIPIKYDDSGIGGVLADYADGYNFVPVNAGWKANQELKYPNVRSELWFETAERARLGMLSLMHLEESWQEKLKIQAMSTKWSLDAARRRVVEPKEATKKRLGRSPDALDAMNLSFWNPGGMPPMMIGSVQEAGQTEGAKLGILGRGINAVDDVDARRDTGTRERSVRIHTLGRGVR